MEKKKKKKKSAPESENHFFDRTTPTVTPVTHSLLYYVNAEYSTHVIPGDKYFNKKKNNTNTQEFILLWEILGIL